MPNNLFNVAQNNNIMSEYGKFQNNPMQYLIEHNADVTEEELQNPQMIIQRLMNSGKLSQNKLNHLMQLARMFGFRF